MEAADLINYYAALDLPLFTAKADTIRDFYLRATEKFHPRSYSGSDIKDRLVAINEAFLMLSDGDAKRLYDAALSVAGECDLSTLEPHIHAKRAKARAFVESYFAGTQKKKRSVWKVVGIVLLVLCAISVVGRILASVIPGPTEKISVYTPPSNWTHYTIDRAFTIAVPPTLELRTEYDRYTRTISDYRLDISNADAVFQQRGLSDMDGEAFDTYCRIIAERYYVGADHVEHHNEAARMSSQDYRACPIKSVNAEAVSH